MDDPQGAPPRPDLPTLAAGAVVVYALSNVIHEGLGHGGACLLVGGTPRLLTSMTFDGDLSRLPGAAARIVAAGGTVANFLAAAVAILALRRARKASTATWLFLWLLATVCLLQGTGYFLFSGVGGVGDWAVVVGGLPGAALWRALLAVGGGLSYWLATRWAMGRLGAGLRATGPARIGEAYSYTLVPYLTGAILYVIAGSLDPAGVAILMISGVAASLGGTSGLAWGPRLLHDPTLGPAADSLPPLGRDWRWVGAAVLVAALFIFVLGPGIPF